jgi:hypothetical protein
MLFSGLWTILQDQDQVRIGLTGVSLGVWLNGRGIKGVSLCFMSSVEINREGLREIYPSLSLGCFIRKPMTIDYLLKRITSELD